jgi:hypothetical protein
MKELNAEAKTLFLSVVREWCPDLEDLVRSEDLTNADRSIRNRLRDAIGRELCRSGFKSHGVTTERGMVLEDLINWVSAFSKRS